MFQVACALDSWSYRFSQLPVSYLNFNALTKPPLLKSAQLLLHTLTLLLVLGGLSTSLVMLQRRLHPQYPLLFVLQSPLTYHFRVMGE
jgi:hypothetical protein